MKRWIGLLVLALLLTGCAPQQEPVPTATTPTTAPATVPPTTATPPSSPTEPAVPDATPVWQEALDGIYQAIMPMGADLLLFGDGVLSRYSNGAVLVSRELELPLPGNGLVQVGERSVAYYDAVDNALVILDGSLLETDRVRLEEMPIGDPCLASDGKTVYYCTADGIRVWDADSGISRSLKVQEGNWLGITGSLFDGEYLRCTLAQEDGSIRTLLVSSQTGATVETGDMLTLLTTGGEYYCCVTETEWIFGTWDQQPKNLFVANAIPLPELGMALTATADETGLGLELYDLNTGLRISADRFVGISELTCPVAYQGSLVFLSGSRLCRWSYDLSAQLAPVEDETVYTAYRYTAEDPDTEGLAALRAQADALEQQYGIDILFWNEVTAAEPEGYTFTVEHRTRPYETALAALEAALARFPEGFLKTAASWTGDGTVHILLVRSVAAPGNVCGSQYLLDRNVYIPLALDDSLEERFYHGLGHVLDTLVLVESDAFYEWHTVNPSGFEYDNDYDSWQGRKSKYLQGNNRYFVDSFAMTFPVEDRAGMFAYAMLPGNEDIFSSKYMRAKLKRLRTGMQEAFNLDGEGYPWEQYLN